MTIKVFLADSEPDIMRLTVFRLKRLGFEVDTAENGLQALERVRKKRPDIIFIGEDIPVLDGSKLCSQMRANSSLKDIPVVILSLNGAEIGARILKIGANDFLIKPYSFDQLKEKIDLLAKSL